MTQLPKSFLFPFLLVCYEISLYLSNDIYLPALPEMMKELGLNSHIAQLTLTTWFFGSASVPLILGAITDRYGRRPILLLGGIVYIVMTIICAITSNISLFLIARTIEGAMVPSMLISGYAVIHELYERKQAIQVLALMLSITILAPAFGPFLGSLVLLFAGWRTIFWIIAISAIFCILFLNKWMPETLTPEKRQTLHLIRLGKSYGRIITNKSFMLLMFALGFMFSGFIAWLTAGPLLLINTFHYSAVTFGLVQAIIFAVNILANRLVKNLIERFSVKILIKAGLLFSLVGGWLAFSLAIVCPNSLIAFILAMMVYSFGSGLCFAPLNRSIIETSTEAMGVRMAMFAVWIGVFAVLGSGMASLFFNGEIISLATLIAVLITLSCTALFLNSRLRESKISL
jgi:Bcr/CflA subfamily drug resistance transporter